MPTGPVETPVTTPEEDPIRAMPVEPEVHVPPEMELLKVAVVPWQTVVLPVIGANGLTVSTLVV